MITVTVCIAFLILAALNAGFSQPPNDFVLGKDDDYFLPPVLKGEGFYRSLLINVAFLGVATVAGFQFGTSTHFIIPGTAFCALVLNLAWGFLGAICLHSDARQFVATKRMKLVVGLVGIGILLFVFAVTSIYQKSTAVQEQIRSQGDISTNGQETSQEG